MDKYNLRLRSSIHAILTSFKFTWQPMSFFSFIYFFLLKQYLKDCNNCNSILLHMLQFPTPSLLLIGVINNDMLSSLCGSQIKCLHKNFVYREQKLGVEMEVKVIFSIAILSITIHVSFWSFVDNSLAFVLSYILLMNLNIITIIISLLQYF